MNINLLGFAKTGHTGTQDISAIQTSSQTPLATIMSTSEAGEIDSGCFCSIVSFFENNILIKPLGISKRSIN